MFNHADAPQLVLATDKQSGLLTVTCLVHVAAHVELHISYAETLATVEEGERRWCELSGRVR